MFVEYTCFSCFWYRPRAQLEPCDAKPPARSEPDSKDLEQFFAVLDTAAGPCNKGPFGRSMNHSLLVGPWVVANRLTSRASMAIVTVWVRLTIHIPKPGPASSMDPSAGSRVDPLFYHILNSSPYFLPHLNHEEEGDGPNQGPILQSYEFVVVHRAYRDFI